MVRKSEDLERKQKHSSDEQDYKSDTLVNLAGFMDILIQMDIIQARKNKELNKVEGENG